MENRRKERFFKKSEKIRGVLNLLLFHFEAATLPIQSHILPFLCSILLCAVIIKRSSPFYGTKNLNCQRIGSKLSETTRVSRKGIRISGKSGVNE